MLVTVLLLRQRLNHAVVLLDALCNIHTDQIRRLLSTPQSQRQYSGPIGCHRSSLEGSLQSIGVKTFLHVSLLAHVYVSTFLKYIFQC